MIPITRKVQYIGEDKITQLKSKRTVRAAGSMLRRRLSSIFHFENADNGFFSICLPGRGTFGSSHRTICQSPRIHRCEYKPENMVAKDLLLRCLLYLLFVLNNK